MELRSLLLSAKHGIIKEDLSKEYREITGVNLDFRKLNFQSIGDLMDSMPDVARAGRDPSGQIVYHAVSDASTSHIQKMVQKQNSKKKKSRGRGRGGRGGRGHFRGGPFPARGAANFGGQDPFRGRRAFAERGRKAKRGQVRFTMHDDRDHVNTWNSNYYSPDREVSRSEIENITPNAALHSHTLHSPVKNLQINIRSNGARTITSEQDSRGGSDMHKRDLRNYLTEMRANRNLTDSNNGPQIKSFVGKNKKVVNENQENFRKELPPRFQRKRQNSEQNLDVPLQEPSSPFVEEKALHSIDAPNWQVPENGEEYLKTFINYFTSRGEEPPLFEISEGKYLKRKGYYGRLRYNGVLYYPLVILETEEHAKFSAAKDFCKQNNIPLMSHTVSPTSISISKQSEPRYNAVRSDSSRLQAPITMPPQPVSQGNTLSDKDIVQKIYKILTETGVFIKALGDRYDKHYGELLPIEKDDLKAYLLNWPDFFSLEENIPGRFIVYPAPDALTKTCVTPVHQDEMKSGINPNPEANVVSEIKPLAELRVPPCHLPEVGNVIDGVVSFVYSPDEFYFRNSGTEHILQAMEEVLNSTCSAVDSPRVETVLLNSYLVGQYMEGWYRAKVKKIDSNKVRVMYIDYGNSEDITIDCLQHLPDSDLVVNTPALAIKCALRKPNAADWKPDATEQLESLLDCSVLKVKIVGHEVGQCVVDLCDSSNKCINESLSISQEKSENGAAPVPPSQVKLIPPEKPNAAAPIQATPTEANKPGDSVIASSTSANSTPSKVVLKTVEPPPVTTQTAKTPEKNVQFTPDPDPLVIPQTDELGVFVCDVLSENSVLIRIVDSDYSDKLDDLQNEIAEKFDSWSEVKEVKLSNVYAGATNADPEEFDEQGDEEETEWELEGCKSYHRVRVISREEKDKYYCYLPDHGDFDILEKSDLRVMDPKLNTSLPYQVIAAKLKGLESVPPEHKRFAIKCLKKLLLSDDSDTYVAVITDRFSTRADADVHLKLSRVRKILSCLADVEPQKVSQIYQDVYKEPCDNMEDFLKEMPGFGCWKESLEITLFDTEHEEEDVDINNLVKEAVNDVAAGEDAHELFSSLFGSSLSSLSDEEESGDDSPDSNKIGEQTDSEKATAEQSTRPSPVTKSGPVNMSAQDQAQNVPPSQKRLYTWKTDTLTPPASAPSTLSASQSSEDMKEPVSQYWSLPLLKSVPIYVVSVDSPSDFVAIPADYQKEMEMLRASLYHDLSKSAVCPTSLVLNQLYAARIADAFHRAFYKQPLGQKCKVYLPDSCQFEVVPPSDMFLLPEPYSQLPFVANRMCLGGLKPIDSFWSNEAKLWFTQQVLKKTLYAIVEKKETDPGLPPLWIVNLIDTNHEDDLLINDLMIQMNMATRT
ncbi:hypothetical protein Btru_010525 [Bulinus truncatus]|nr:hypothetical protein Btru_010525 [Bulinus truncatus]